MMLPDGSSHILENLVPFVKSAQALDMPVHQGQMDAECTAAMWSDAGVGVAVQRIVMKHVIGFFGHKFAVPETAINELAAHSVPRIVGRMEYMNRMLNCWHQDLACLLAGQIANLHAAVNFFIGADHGQGSFRAGVKVIRGKADRSVAATDLGKPKTLAPFWHWHSLLSQIWRPWKATHAQLSALFWTGSTGCPFMTRWCMLCRSLSSLSILCSTQLWQARRAWTKPTVTGASLLESTEW
jgi:hypothetical protein